MKTKPGKPSLINKRWDELPLSNDDLLLLMQEVLAKGAQFQFRAKGWSMSPFIKDGDVLTISPPLKEKLTIGKVVAFIQPTSNQLVVHRVIGRRGDSVLIKGDNSVGQPDELINTLDILGCVARIERNGCRVTLGLGLERFLIAILSRYGWLYTITKRLRFFKTTYKS